MAACPSIIRISLSFSNKIELPVGNSPGPEISFKYTEGELFNSFPASSRTETVNKTSSVPSVRTFSVFVASNFSRAGMPSTGHTGGATWVYSLRYQYHERLGIRK